MPPMHPCCPLSEIQKGKNKIIRLYYLYIKAIVAGCGRNSYANIETESEKTQWNESIRVLLVQIRVTPMGFKPMILGTGILHSIQLNYGAFLFCWLQMYYYFLNYANL